MNAPRTPTVDDPATWDDVATITEQTIHAARHLFPANSAIWIDIATSSLATLLQAAVLDGCDLDRVLDWLDDLEAAPPDIEPQMSRLDDPEADPRWRAIQGWSANTRVGVTIPIRTGIATTTRDPRVLGRLATDTSRHVRRAVASNPVATTAIRAAVALAGGT